MDINSIRAAINCEELRKMTDVVGKEDKFPVKDFQVIMKDGCVTTVVKN